MSRTIAWTRPSGSCRALISVSTGTPSRAEEGPLPEDGLAGGEAAQGPRLARQGAWRDELADVEPEEFVAPVSEERTGRIVDFHVAPVRVGDEDRVGCLLEEEPVAALRGLEVLPGGVLVCHIGDEDRECRSAGDLEGSGVEPGDEPGSVVAVEA